MADVLFVVMRWIHLASMATLIGGIIFARLVMSRTLDALAGDARETFSERAAALYRPLVFAAITGLVLYAINFGIVSLLWPDARGNEVAIAFAHVVFGLVAAGAYRGLLRRTVQAEVRGQEPGFTSQ